MVCAFSALYILLFLVPFSPSRLQSPNKLTQAPEKIRPLTSLDHPQGPFYDPEGGAITPVARVVVERIARKVCPPPRLLCVFPPRPGRCSCSHHSGVPSAELRLCTPEH